MAPIGESSVPKASKRGQGSGFFWVSSSPTPAEVTELESRFPEVIRIPASTLEESSLCWKDKAILTRTFQRWVSPEAFLREFRRAGVSGGIQSLSLAHRCHIFRFEELGSKDLVLGRPWVINGQPVAMEDWHPEFIPAVDSVSSALLWVRLPSLPVEFWNEEVLRHIMAPAGEFICVDSATRLLSRGGFARVCIRVDLRRPLRPGVRVQGLGTPFWQQFQFEHLEGICPSCGSIHLTGPCSSSSSPPVAAQTSSEACFGPWMSAIRHRRPAGSVQSKPELHSGTNPAASVPPSAASVNPSQSSEDWSLPAKVARRRNSKDGRSSGSAMANPGLQAKSASLKMESGLLSAGSSGIKGVPVEPQRAGVDRSLQAESNQIQKEGSELQFKALQKLNSNNPFALLSMGNEVGEPSSRVDVNPGASKRARPEESHPLRMSSISNYRKGKGAASLVKGSKGKINPSNCLIPGQDASTANSSADKAILGKEPVCVVKEGQNTEEEIRIHTPAPSSIEVTLQGLPVDPAPSEEEYRADGSIEETAVQRDDHLSMDCSMQVERGGTQSEGYLSDSEMLENQGGLHPSSQV